MERVTISKRILDRLIRAKLVQIEGCQGVNALPVMVKGAPDNGCIWTIPGWTGEAQAIDRCHDKMKTYIEFLRGQFNVSEQ
jgi:hypothetical protein